MGRKGATVCFSFIRHSTFVIRHFTLLTQTTAATKPKSAPK